MPFDLRAALTEFHQTIMELSSPLLERIDAVPSLQVLQPYRDSLPYLAAALGLLLFLVLARVLRRPFSRKQARKKKKESFQTMAVPAPAPVSFSLSAPVKTPIQGRAVDIAPDFDVPLSFPAAPAALSNFSAAAPETVSEPVPAPQDAAPQRPAALAQDAAAASPAPTESSPVSQPAAGAPIAEPAPSLSLSDAAVAVSAAPVASAPAPAVQLEVPEPPGPAPAPSRVTPLNADFRKIYVVMYIDLELATNFSALLEDVNGRLARKDPTEPLMPTGSGGPEDEIFAHLALAALDELRSDDFLSKEARPETEEARLETGALSPHSQELRAVYAYALQRLRESGRLAEEPAQNLLQETLQKRH